MDNQFSGEEKQANAVKTEVLPVIEENKKDSDKKNKNIRLFLFGLSGFLGVAILAFVVFGLVRVYVQASFDPATLMVAKTLRLPVMKINGVNVLYSEYAGDINALNQLIAYEAQGGTGVTLSPEEKSAQVLTRLVNNVLMTELAKHYGLKVEDEEVEVLKTQIISQFDDPSALEKELQDRYGWTMEQYTTKVIRPYVLETKISEKITTDEEAVLKVRENAETVLEQIKKGADFGDMAEEYGEDGTAEFGGDLGWFGKNQMVPSFETAVFSMEKGTLKDTLVETEYGYHIVYLEDKKIEETKDSAGKTVKEEMVKAHHILFMFPSLNKYLQNAVKNMDFHLYINVPNPFEVKEEIENEN